MIRNIFFAFIVLFLPANAMAFGVDFKLGSDTAEITYLTESATFGYGGADIGVGVFINENNDLITSGSVLVTGSGDGDVRALHFGVGIKAFVGTLGTIVDPVSGLLIDPNGGALTLGGQIRYVFPSGTPIAILFEAFGAPSVTSIADFDGITELRAAVELEVTPSARAYVGWREITIELDSGGEYKADGEVHLGVRFAF